MKNFVEEVMQRLQGGSERKIGKFHNKAIKVWEKQIDNRKDEIAELKEKVEEITVDLIPEARLAVDLERINTTDSTAQYVQDYQNVLIDLKGRFDELNLQIKGKEKEIENYEWLISTIKGNKK